jgi:hypothetical protein
MARTTLTVIAVLLASHTAVAHAEPKKVAATFSPIHLVFPMFELQVEARVAPKIGVSVIAAAGRVSNEDETITATAYEAGAQFGYYFLDDFEGLHAGIETLYLHLGDVEQDLSATAAGLTIGPIVGYKLVTSVGFTFLAQGGVQFVTYQASSDTASTREQKKVLPNLNLNVGWSF